MKKFFLLAAVALTVNAFGQKVSNKLQFTKGQKLEVVSEMQNTVSIDMMGQAIDTKVDMVVTRTLDVENVQNGAATIEHKVKRMQMNVESPMAGSQKFDSDNEKDMKGEGGKAAEKALKNKYTMTVDASGKITSVKADDDNPNKAPAAGNDMMVPPGTEGFNLPKEGDISEFRILPEKEVGKGESWEDNSATMKKKYTVSDITDSEIIVDFTTEGNSEMKQEANGMEIVMKTKDKSTGKIVVDRKTGIMKQRTETIDAEGTMDVMGQSAPLKTKTVKTTTVK